MQLTCIPTSVGSPSCKVNIDLFCVEYHPPLLAIGWQLLRWHFTYLLKRSNFYEINLYITADQDVLASLLAQPSTITLLLKSFPFFWKMDKMCIPNTQKWIHYYQNLGKDEHNPYVNYSHWRGQQIGGGFLSGSPQQCITPVGPSHKGGHDEKGTVNLVSPVQQSIDQAKDEVKRNIQGIKRKTTDKTVSPTREHRRKQIENVKKVSKKNMKKKYLRKRSTVKRLNRLKKKKKPKSTTS